MPFFATTGPNYVYIHARVPLVPTRTYLHGPKSTHKSVCVCENVQVYLSFVVLVCRFSCVTYCRLKRVTTGLIGGVH